MFYRKHKRVSLNTGDLMVTKQSHKDECDIHRILNQFKRTGIITHVQNAQANFQDLPDDLDFQNAMNTLLIAQNAFEDLPSTVRATFNNSPMEFLTAFHDPTQAPRLRELGFLLPLPEPVPTPEAK